MNRIRAAVALLALLTSPALAPAQEVDTTLWTRLRFRFVGPEGNRAVAVVGEPGNPSVAYVGAASGGVWKTEDAGVHWRAGLDRGPPLGIAGPPDPPPPPPAAGGGPGGGLGVAGEGGARGRGVGAPAFPAATHAIGKIAVAVAASNPNTVYALIEDQDPTLYRSDDRGTTWRIVSRNHDMAERAPYYVRFTVAPDDEERLYFVSVRFSMSRDGGQTLTRSPFSAGGDNHDIWIDPLNADRILIAHDGGASFTLNRGKSYTRPVPPLAPGYHLHSD